MRALIVAACLAALLSPAAAAAVDTATGHTPPRDRLLLLALNPQPEPPGREKIKRIYDKKDDSRRLKNLKPINSQKPLNQAPATKY